MTSPRTNTRVLSFIHAYPYDGYDSRVVLNESSSQIHVHTVEQVVKGEESEWWIDVFAYDLASGAPVEARDIVPERQLQPSRDNAGPTVDLSHLEDTSTRYRAIAFNPDGLQLLVRRFDGADMMDATVSTILIDPRTGQQLLPPMPAR